MLLSAIVAGALAGLASVPHCAAMCGPLCAASCARAPRSPLPSLRYQLGRTLGYAFVGSIAGQLGALIERSWLVAVSPLLIAVGVAAALLWLARGLWRRAAPATVPLRRPASRHAALTHAVALLPREPLAVGAVSALLPCGALAAGLLLAAGSGERIAGAATMAAFSLTSGLGVLFGGALLARIARVRGPRMARALAIALVAVAALVIARPFVHARAEAAAAAAPCH